MKKNNYTIKKLFSLIVGLVIAFGSQAVQLSGSYTINTSNPATATNFKDFVSAVNYLTSATTRPDGGPVNAAPFGVSGPVTFNVASGIYTGQTIIPFVTGTSASNTITFQSSAIHTDSVTLAYSSGTNPVVRLDSARYINFRFMTVNSIAGRAFELTKGASYDTIGNCKMTVGNAGIYATNLAGGRNVFMFNNITGGQYSIWLRGTSTIYSDSNVVANNTMLTATTNGCNFYYTQYLQVKNNIIRSGGTVTTLLIGYCNSSFIANNSIISGGTGIDNSNAFSQRFYHNSISAVNYGITILYNNATYSNNDWRNNIIYSSGTTATSSAANINLTGSSNNTWNYNAYYANSANLFATTPSAYSTWKGTGQDLNSVVMAPGFANATDLHLTSGCKTGTPLALVTTDIEGNTRNILPTMGAYEYTGINNLTISGLLKPGSAAITPGLQDLKAIIKNVGNNAVTSFTISYVLNGRTPVFQTWTGTLAPCDTVSVTFTGLNQMDLLTRNKLTVYTNSPNGVVDSAPINDTLSANLYAPLNGAYSIGPLAANFLTFTEAVTALSIGGITGPVVFNVQSGIYTEQVLVPFIQGTSATNSIKFQSAVNNADSVIIRFSAAANIPIVKLDQASNIHFKYITVSSLTATGRGFEIGGAATSDSISYCKISAGNHGIYAAAITGSKHVFSYNTITGGAIGIYLYGISATVQTDSNIIAYNTILNSTSYGCDLRFTKNLKVNNNTISGNNALQIQYSYGALKVISNVITGINVGLINYYSYGDLLAPTLVANNRITSTSTGGTTVYNYQGSNQRYYHNTISSANAGAGFDYGAVNNDNNDWKNNIIVSSAAAAGYSIGGSNLGANNTLDYNLYYTASGASPFTTFANLAAWQTAKGWDLHSVVTNPDFASATDFHLKAGCKSGITVTGVPTDIEGNVRATPPTVGAYEYSVINDMAIDKVLQPEVGNTVTGLQNLIVRVKNTGANTVTSFDISYVLNGGSVVTESWSGSLTPCDTVSVTFTGTKRINLGGTNTITIYTSNPNLGADPNRTNDTLTKLLYPSLNGTYTIGHSGAQFASFNAAVTNLINGGIMGPVIFQVQTGTYTEQFTIPNIIGTSATNTITFKSAVNNADSVTINYNTAVDEHIIKLLNASFINFKYVTVASLTPNGRLFTLTGTCSQDSFTYCKINTGQMGIFANVTGRKHVVSYNTITGLGFGIYLTGTGTTDLLDSSIVTYNTLLTTAVTGATYGCYLSYSKNVKVSNNTITGFSNGIRYYYHRDAMEILANKIVAVGASSYGINISEVIGKPSAPALIANNSIVSDNYGISNNNGSYQYYYHNSINAVKSGIEILYDAVSLNNEWKNNIVATQVATGGYTAYFDGPTSSNKLDYNLYYNASMVSPIRFYTSLASWQAGTGNDKHSFVYTAPFTSLTNLQPNIADSASWTVNGRGIHIDSTLVPLIATDIIGRSRPTNRAAGVPDIGAYEITPTALPPLALASGYLMLDSTRIFISPITRDTVAKVKLWNISTIPAKLEIRQYTGIAPPIAKPTDKFMYHYLDVKDSGSGGYFYDITTYYNEIWLGTITAEQDLRLTHKNGTGPWYFSNSATLSFVDTAKNTITDGQLLQFGLITGTDLFNPLPVELILFKAIVKVKDVLLNWATASELNSNGFIIERSSDNKTWNKIGNVKANGNTSSTSTYQFNDASAFVNVNTLFYRLRMVDNDGSFAYSKTVTVNNKTKVKNNEMIVYPNPFTSNVVVSFVNDNADAKATITVMNITGQTLHTEMMNTLTGTNNATINLEELQSGIYLISVELNGTKTNMKLVKN